MRHLADIKREKENKKRITEERRQYKKSGAEIPLSHWTSKQMYDYFLQVKSGEKRISSILNKFNKRTVYSAMAAINHSRINGEQFVALVDWSKERNDLKSIWHILKNIPKFEKENPQLFGENYGVSMVQNVGESLGDEETSSEFANYC